MMAKASGAFDMAAFTDVVVSSRIVKDGPSAGETDESDDEKVCEELYDDILDSLEPEAIMLVSLYQQHSLKILNVY